MPNIIVKVPEGVFDQAGREALAKGITAAAKKVEGIGDDPHQEFLVWVIIDEVKTGNIFAGGSNPLDRVVPAIVFFHPPAGVLDETGRVDAVALIHQAVAAAKPASDPRPVITSVIVSDVPDGTWGVNGQLWRLADFTRAAGYRHLQHLIAG